MLNPDKFQFAERTEGFRLSDSTIEPLPKYLDAIRDFPTPASTTDIRNWFGLVNQVANYAQLRETMAPFKPFLSPRCKFSWSSELENAFRRSKHAIIEAIREGVEIYHMQKRTCLRPDWSRRGIGYFILQQHCRCSSSIPACCPGGLRITVAGSRFLSFAEQRYAAIEGEALAVAWGLEQTRYFTQGCDNLVVVTDHKPLVKIFGGRTLDEITNTRLFRLKQRTLPWRFDIDHVPGKSNHAADAASRHPSPSGSGSGSDGQAYQTWLSLPSWLPSAMTHKSSVPSHGLSSHEKQQQTHVLATCCTSSSMRVASTSTTLPWRTSPPSASPSTHRTASCCLMTASWYPSPSMNESSDTSMLHTKEPLPWNSTPVPSCTGQGYQMTSEPPGRGVQIATAMHCRKQPHPLYHPHHHPLPLRQCLRTFFDYGGRHYLVVGDRLSGWVEVLSSTAGTDIGGSAGLVRHLRAFFATFGVPEEPSSDGGPEFTTSLTANFLRLWDVRHRVSSVSRNRTVGRRSQ